MALVLERTWVLTKAPLVCRQSMLEEIHIQIRKGYAFVCDTINSTGGKLVHKVNPDGRSGSISIMYDGWTQTGRAWNDDQLLAEASIVDAFIHSLIRTEFNYELVDGVLIVHFEGGKYHFTART